MRVTPSSRWWWLIGIAVIVAVAAGTWGMLHKDARGASLSGGPSAAISTATLPTSQVALFQTALTAADPVTAEKALAPQVRAAYDRSPFRMLPSGSTVVIDAQKLTVSGDGATIPATVTGGSASGQWLLLLTNVNRQWLIYGTRRP